MTNTASSKRIFNLVLGGVMVAMATVLGFIKLYDAPYGGSITVCSMLPILFFGYRCGLKWGLGAGFVNSVLQLLLGMSALKGVSAGVLVGSIFLDYLIAFTVLGLAGMFRGRSRMTPWPSPWAAWWPCSCGTCAPSCPGGCCGWTW